MMVLEVGDVPPEPVSKSPSEVPVPVTSSTSSLELEYPRKWMKAQLEQVIETNVKAHDHSTRLPAQDATSMRSVAEEPREAREDTKDPKEVLK